jgi:hypothetical protein
MGFEAFRTMVFSGWDPLVYGTVYFDIWEQAFRRNLLLSWYCEDEGVFSSKMKVQNTGLI